MAIKYTAEAVSSGGRDGTVRSSDGVINERVGTPQAMGGSGEGTNPEQLFAAAFAACFNGALHLVAKRDGMTLPEASTITAQVGIGPDSSSFSIAATLVGYLPGFEQSTADQLMSRAHEVCPYSKATRGNVEVTLRSKV